MIIHFSLVIPTRLRVNTLKKSLESIRDTVEDPATTEVRLIVDEDDLYTLRLLEELKLIYSHTKIHTRSRGTNYVDDYFNWCMFSFCKGKYMIGGTDDALMRLKGWDVKCYERLEKYLENRPDGIVCGILDDKERDPKRLEAKWLTCDYPIISMNGCRAVECYFDSRFPRYGSDWDITYTYNMVGRIIDLRDICIYEREPLEIQETTEMNIININKDPLPASVGLSYPIGFFVNENIDKINNYLLEKRWQNE